MDPVPWREAWQDALYGPTGFYRAPDGPAGHFTTSAHGPLGDVLAEGVARLCEREGVRHVVDVGAGRGELLTALHAARPDLRLTGLDVVPRPDGLPDAVAWLVSPGGPRLPDDLSDLDDVLVLAHEWLDVVPCTVAEVDDDGRLRVVLVDCVSGVETLGPPLAEHDPDDAAWAARHWPTGRATGAEPGDRVEVGRSRDEAWADLLSRIRSGTGVAVDYGHTIADRPAGGTLVGYRRGTLTTPVPDGSCDVTAHVATDSLQADEVRLQADLLADLGLTAARPPRDTARTDPTGYLAALGRASAVAALRAPDGLGAFHWVLRRVGRG